MNLILIVLTLLIAAVVWWNCWQAQLRAVALQPWTPPAHVWARWGTFEMATEPGGTELRLSLPGDVSKLVGGTELHVVVAAKRQADARTRLGLDPFLPERAAYEYAGESRVVDGVEWRRWDLVSDER